MTISKCILFTSIILGANFAHAGTDGSNCANAAQSALTGNRQADVETARALTRTTGDAEQKKSVAKDQTGSAS